MLLKATHSKMNNIAYYSLDMQPYLTRADISIEQKRILIKWQVKMNDFGENFRAGRKEVLCPLCQKHRDFPYESFKCPSITQSVNIKGNYSDIYHPDYENLPQLMETLENITNFRKR